MKSEIKIPIYEQKKVPLNMISLPENLERQYTDPDKLEELILSIKTVGLIHPIVLVKKDNKLILVAGYCRFQAFQKLNKKIITARLIEADNNTINQITLDENYNRLPINAVDEAVFLARIKVAENLSNKKLAELIHKSESYILERLKLIEIEDYIRNGILKDEITPKIALELDKITDDIERERCFNQAVEYGLDLKTVKQQVQTINFDLKQKKLDSNNNENVKPERSVYMPAVDFCELCETKTSYLESKMIRVCPDCLTSAKANLRPQENNNLV